MGVSIRKPDGSGPSVSESFPTLRSRSRIKTAAGTPSFSQLPSFLTPVPLTSLFLPTTEMITTKAKRLALLVLILFFQHPGHSPAATAHEGAPDRGHVGAQTQQLPPLQTLQHHAPAGSNVTVRWTEGLNGGQEDAEEDRGPRPLWRRSVKSSSGGAGGSSGGGASGGSGGKGGRSSGGGEMALRQTPGRSSSSSRRRTFRGVPVPCALASGLVQYGMVVLLPALFL